MLKKQANAMREQMMKDRETARSMMNETKYTEAENERSRRKEEEQHLKRVRSIEIAENQLKAKNIRK